MNLKRLFYRLYVNHQIAFLTRMLKDLNTGVGEDLLHSYYLWLTDLDFPEVKGDGDTK